MLDTCGRNNSIYMCRQGNGIHVGLTHWPLGDYNEIFMLILVIDD